METKIAAVMRANGITYGVLVINHQAGGTIFPPAFVMPLARLRPVILAWVRTGQRPTAADWLPISALVWELTEDGRVHVPGPAH